MPFLSRISLPSLQDGSYIQHIPSLNKGLQLNLKDNVTFFVGENGSGKSTFVPAGSLIEEPANRNAVYNLRAPLETLRGQLIKHQIASDDDQDVSKPFALSVRGSSYQKMGE